MGKYETNGGGVAASCDDVKLFIGSTWAMKMSFLTNTDRKLLIMTHGFGTDYLYKGEKQDKIDYLRGIFEKRPNNIFIICNSDSIDKAQYFKNLYPDISIRHNEKMNAKVALIEDDTVIYTSEDFGFSNCIELGVGFHSKPIYQTIRNQFVSYWKNSSEIVMKGTD